MKILFSILAFTFTATKLCAQLPDTDSNWFFGVSLREQPKAIQAKLNSDDQITKVSKKEIARTNLNDSAYIFFGKLVRPTLFNDYKLDSSTIFLTAGRSNKINNNKYIGYTKILQSEYFTSDGFTIGKLYDIAVNEFKKGSNRKQRWKTLLRTPEKQGERITIAYADSEKQFKRVEIWKSYNPLNKVHSLFIYELHSDN